MNWCISIKINEKSKEEALRLLDETVKKMKVGGNIEHEEYHPEDYHVLRLPRLKYDSYEGI